MRMSEASSGPRWRLTVWFDSASDYQTFDFDVEPDTSLGQKVVTFVGEREGRTVRAYVTFDRVAVWSLEEIAR
jgi:hypothetical protein